MLVHTGTYLVRCGYVPLPNVYERYWTPCYCVLDFGPVPVTSKLIPGTFGAGAGATLSQVSYNRDTLLPCPATAMHA